MIVAEYEVDKIPLCNRMMFVSLLKKALCDYDENLYKQLYEYKDGKKNKKTKDFAFTTFKQDYKVDAKNSEINLSAVTLKLSSPNKALLIKMYNALVRLSEYTYKGEYTLKKKRVKIVHDGVIKNDYALFKTMSPIVVKNKDGRFLDIQDEDYLENLNYIADKVLFNYRGFGLQRPLMFTPVSMEQVIIKEYIKGFTDVTGKENFYINSYKGAFLLRGDVTDLNDIYKLGLGFRRSEGFGMLGIA